MQYSASRGEGSACVPRSMLGHPQTSLGVLSAFDMHKDRSGALGCDYLGDGGYRMQNSGESATFCSISFM